MSFSSLLCVEFSPTHDITMSHDLKNDEDGGRDGKIIKKSSLVPVSFALCWQSVQKHKSSLNLCALWRRIIIWIQIFERVVREREEKKLNKVIRSQRKKKRRRRKLKRFDCWLWKFFLFAGTTATYKSYNPFQSESERSKKHDEKLPCASPEMSV